MKKNTNNFTINYKLKWYLVMSCLLFKPSDVLLGKQLRGYCYTLLYIRSLKTKLDLVTLLK